MAAFHILTDLSAFRRQTGADAEPRLRAMHMLVATRDVMKEADYRPSALPCSPVACSRAALPKVRNR